LDKRIKDIDDDTAGKVADIIFETSDSSSRCVVLGMDAFNDSSAVKKTMIAFTEKNPLSSSRVRDYGEFGAELREKITKAHDSDRIYFEYLEPDDPGIEKAISIGLYKAEVNIVFFIKMQ